MIRDLFSQWEDRIAVGLVGEGSDCFGYDDAISRDHDFGTGVCLWITEEDMEVFGRPLSIAYNELVDGQPGSNLSDRMRERRGVMTIGGFYSNVLGARVDAEGCRMSASDWLRVDQSCLATAVNGTVFRDDLGKFTAFRNLLLSYYPDSVWRRRIAEECHKFSASLQVNYARCMARKDLVAAEMCRARGIEAAMELFFLLKREYPPYYKWTYHRLAQIDGAREFSKLLKKLAASNCDPEAWESRGDWINQMNRNDKVVRYAEELGSCLAFMFKDAGLVKDWYPYLETYVNLVLP